MLWQLSQLCNVQYKFYDNVSIYVSRIDNVCMYTYCGSCTCSVAQGQFWRDFGGKIQGVLTHTKACGYAWWSAHAQ